MFLKDDLGREFEWNGPPQRIISLCPSQTELLYTLGLGNQVVGRTRFCIHPSPSVYSAKRVGGTKDVDLQRVRELNPDLILAEKEEQTAETVAELERESPVCVTKVESITDALKMIIQVGNWTGTESLARVWHNRIVSAFENIRTVIPAIRVAYLIWREPWMAVGSGTYIDSVLQHMGMTNVFAERQERYPVISLTELKELEIDCVFLSSEPYPFGNKHILEINQVISHQKCLCVDGEWFSWYGSRMWIAAPQLSNVLQTISRINRL